MPDGSVVKRVNEKEMSDVALFLHQSVPESQEVPEASCGRGRGPVEVDACRRGGGVRTAEIYWRSGE